MANLPNAKGTPRGFHLVSAFLFFGMWMALLAAYLLAFPGTPLDRSWALNPQAHVQMAPFGSTLSVAFIVLAFLLLAAAVGWLKRRYWGWLLTVLIIATQVLGDLVNLLRGDWLRGLTGVVIASALLFYLVHPRVRAAFR